MRRAASFAVLLGAGLLVFLVGGYWTGISAGLRTLVKCALPAVLALTVPACRRFDALKGWDQAAVGLLAASCGFLASWLVADLPLDGLGVPRNSAPGLAIAKLLDTLPIVIAALLVARAGGLRPADLYLRTGRVRIWLTVGLLAFYGFTALLLLQAGNQGLALRSLLGLAPWIGVFVLANGFMEELHFRGLLLRPFGQLLGHRLANLCIALIFALVHAPVSYTSDTAAFVAAAFLLALAWGYLIQRSGALWGSVLFHAGADLVIILDIYRAYGAL